MLVFCRMVDALGDVAAAIATADDTPPMCVFWRCSETRPNQLRSEDAYWRTQDHDADGRVIYRHRTAPQI